jgi:Lrp/AsnC family leucine-responsive transcriptional regulator
LRFPAISGSGSTENVSGNHDMTELHVLVEMAGQERRHTDAFKAAMARSPEVQAAWDVTGETDFLLNVAVRSMADYETFCQRELTAEAHVKGFKSMITIREVVAFDPARRTLQI